LTGTSKYICRHVEVEVSTLNPTLTHFKDELLTIKLQEMLYNLYLTK